MNRLTEQMAARRCQSKSEFGCCRLEAGHLDDHAVFIGPPDFWFLYTRRSRHPVGYAKWDDETGWTLK